MTTLLITSLVAAASFRAGWLYALAVAEVRAERGESR